MRGAARGHVLSAAPVAPRPVLPKRCELPSSAQSRQSFHFAPRVLTFPAGFLLVYLYLFLAVFITVLDVAVSVSCLPVAVLRNTGGRCPASGSPAFTCRCRARLRRRYQNVSDFRLVPSHRRQLVERKWLTVKAFWVLYLIFGSTMSRRLFFRLS